MSKEQHPNSSCLLFKSALMAATACMAFAVGHSTASAQSITIRNGETRNTPQMMNNNNDVGIIEKGGTLIFNGGVAAFGAAGQNARIENRGTIRSNSTDPVIIGGGDNFTGINHGTLIANGNGTFGMAINSNNATLSNTGTLSVTGNTAFGLFASGNRSLLTNDGTITITGTQSYAIESRGAGNRGINRGTVELEGAGAVALHTAGADTTLINDGTIRLRGNEQFGIADRLVGLAVPSTSNLVNNGTIVGHGALTYGIFTQRKSGHMQNNGTIDVGSFGMQAASDDVTMQNDGKIIISGENGIAMSVRRVTTTGTASMVNNGTLTVNGLRGSGMAVIGSGDVVNNGAIYAPRGWAYRTMSRVATDVSTLTLGPNSIMAGRLSFGNATDHLVIDPAMARSMTYEFDNAPNTINTNGLDALSRGNQLIVFSKNDTAETPWLLGDMGGMIQNSLNNQRTSPSGQQKNNGNDLRLWGALTGHMSKYRSRKGNPESDVQMGGIVSGVEASPMAERKLGAYIGFAAARNTQNFQADRQHMGVFGGVYGSVTSFLDASVTMGYINSDMNREVLNNMSATGIEKIKARRSAWLISPQITAKLGQWQLGDITFRPSVRSRYSFQHRNAYSEKNGMAPMHYTGWNSHTLDNRIEMAFDLLKDEKTNISFKTGMDTRFAFADKTITASVAGRSFRRQIGGKKRDIGLFAGMTLSHNVSDKISLYANFEASSSTAQSYKGSSNVGLSVNF